MPRLVILVRGEVVPYTTTTRDSRWRERYRRYGRFKGRVKSAVVEQMYHAGIKMSEQEPLRLAVVCNKRSGLHQMDMTNILKGTEDGAQHKAYANDGWVDQEAAMRALAPDLEDDAILLIIQPIDEGPERFSDWLAEVEKTALEWGFRL